MKKFSYFLLFGLMSLISLTSCEDKIITQEEPEFMPYGYQPKIPETQEFDDLPIVTSFQILGYKNLVISEFEKDDWKIIVPDHFLCRGDQPLKVTNPVEVTNFRKVLDIPTNYEELPVAFGNTAVPYEYMGQTTMLEPIGGVMLTLTIKERFRREQPMFLQYGYIKVRLNIAFVPIAETKIPFMVLDDTSAPNWDWDDDDDNGADNGSEY